MKLQTIRFVAVVTVVLCSVSRVVQSAKCVRSADCPLEFYCPIGIDQCVPCSYICERKITATCLEQANCASYHGSSWTTTQREVVAAVTESSSVVVWFAAVVAIIVFIVVVVIVAVVGWKHRKSLVARCSRHQTVAYPESDTLGGGDEAGCRSRCNEVDEIQNDLLYNIGARRQ